MIDKESGLTEQEQSIMNHLVNAWNEFIKLETQHLSERTDFMNAIHTLQNIIAMRIVRRNYPEYWLSYKGDK